MSRDYSDLDNKDLAVYNFRGYTVFKYNMKTKEFSIGENAHLCSLIPDDLFLMSEFLIRCKEHSQDRIFKVKSVEVE